MKGRARIGELLSRMVPLSGHDVEEILQEQQATHRKFGEIALAWGLCQPEHVSDAWVQQAQQTLTIDLDEVGIDAGAASLLPGDVARRLGVIPVRCVGDVALVATAEESVEQMITELSGIMHRQVKFIRADRRQLGAMLDRYYPHAA